MPNPIKIILIIIGIILISTYGMNTGLLYLIALSLASIADTLSNKFPIK